MPHWSAFQVSGLASGLDTQSIISQLMSIEQQPLNKIKVQQTTHNSQVKAIATLKTAISEPPQLAMPINWSSGASLQTTG